jgi:hypothetical protein
MKAFRAVFPSTVVVVFLVAWWAARRHQTPGTNR